MSANTRVDDTLERIRLALNFGHEKFLSMVRLSESEYQRYFAKFKRPPKKVIEHLAEELDLCSSAILSGKIDFVALSAHFSGNPTYLPERYSYKALSRRRTSVHLLNSIERKYGWRARERVLRKLQVNESMFIDLDASINIQFVSDLCQEIRVLDSGENTLFEMGQCSVRTNYYSKLGDIYRDLSSPQEIYEMTFPQLAKSYYDTNTHYRLVSLSETSCVVEVTANLELVEAFKAKAVGSLGTCEQKRGVFSSLPLYQNLPPAQVYELSCMHKGDARCLFYVNFQASSRLSKERRREMDRRG